MTLILIGFAYVILWLAVRLYTTTRQVHAARRPLSAARRDLRTLHQRRLPSWYADVRADGRQIRLYLN